MNASVRLTHRYAASPEEVWAAITEPESVAPWLHDERACMRYGAAWTRAFDRFQRLVAP